MRARAPRRGVESAGLGKRALRTGGATNGPAALRWTVLPALLVLAFYVWIYPARRFRLALGSDTPVYVWWARRTAALGFRALLAGPRPGTVGPLAALSGALDVRVGTVIAALQPVLAVSIALATAALVEACLGRDRLRFAVVALLTGAFLSLLVPGYLSTLAFGSAFVAALAVLALAITSDGPMRWRAVSAAAVLFGAAGLAHPLFLGMGAAVAGGAFVAVAWTERRAVSKATVAAISRSNAARLAVSAAGGAGLTLVGLAYIGRAARRPVQTSRDSILRTVGLGELSRISYQHVLARFFPWYRAVVVVAFAGLAAFAVRTTAARRRRAGARDVADGAGDPGPTGSTCREARRLFWGAMAAWVAVTVGGIAALFAGTSAPGQRLSAFCLALPAFGGIGLVAASRRPASAAVRRALLAGGVVGYLAVAMAAWARAQPVIASATSLQIRAAGAALAAEPAGTPLVLIADDRSARAGFSIPRDLNYLRDAVPTDRVQDVAIFVGPPAALLRGAPSPTGIPEHDRIADLFWSDLRPRLAGGPTPLAVVVQAIDPEAYASVFHLPQVERYPPAYRIAPGVLTIPRYDGTAPHGAVEAAAVAYPSDSGAARFSPWTPVVLAPAVLLILAAAGWAWVRALVPNARTAATLPLAPAFGFAAIALAGMVADAAGLRMAKAGGMATVLAAISGGFVALAATTAFRRRPATPPATS